LHLLI